MSREAFEAWYDSQPDGRIQPWDVWQAAQADAFERAASVCLDMSNERQRPLLSPYAAQIRNTRAAQCADAIREMAKEATNA